MHVLGYVSSTNVDSESGSDSWLRLKPVIVACDEVSGEKVTETRTLSKHLCHRPAIVGTVEK